MSKVGFFYINNGTTPDAGGNTPEDFYKVLWITATVLGVIAVIYCFGLICRYLNRSSDNSTEAGHRGIGPRDGMTGV